MSCTSSTVCTALSGMTCCNALTVACMQGERVAIRGDRLCAVNALEMKRRGKQYYDSVAREKTGAGAGIALNETVKEQERRWCTLPPWLLSCVYDSKP